MIEKLLDVHKIPRIIQKSWFMGNIAEMINKAIK